MSTDAKRDIYFSFFMFTADLRPEDPAYAQVLVEHMQHLVHLGYDGFDLHIATRPTSGDHRHEVESYRQLKHFFDQSGLAKAKFATNVGSTPFFDPTSPYAEQRRGALAYLKSRVDITAVLAGDAGEPIMSGPFLYPYGAFPLSEEGEPLWSDALQDWMQSRYQSARDVMEELAEYAADKKVKLALEPVKNWETPPPNMISEALDFVERVKKAPIGITIDTAQVLMESDGPELFRKNVDRAAQGGRLAYVHISPPDRGAVRDSWIPWELMLGAIEPVYVGPYLIEIFNAIPPFAASMRMSRRRFWRPGEDSEGPKHLSAYHVAAEALDELRRQIASVRSACGCDAQPDADTQPQAAGEASPQKVGGRGVTFGGGKSCCLPRRSAGQGNANAADKPVGPANKLAAPIVIVNQYGTLYSAVRIHTFIASYAGDNIANSTHIIESANSLVVIDGQFLAPYAVQFREYADSLKKPIERVYLSHRHPDHWFGLGTAFSDKQIYALKETRDFVRDNGDASVASHVAKMGDLAPKKVVVPQHIVQPGSETIDGVDYVFEEEHDAEVEVQLTIKLPKLGVAIVQDLIYSGTHLYLTKQMEHWEQVLQHMLLSDYDTFLPGHGVPADKNEVAANMEYLAVAREAWASGLSKEKFRDFLLTRYPGRLCPGIFDIYLPRLFDGANQV